jgi:hypothetical protein
MSRVVLLDSGPLGLISNPRGSSETRECTLWLDELVRQGILVKIPEIADYEVRRELLRIGKFKSIQRLDYFKTRLGYVPLTTQTMLKAAEFWAQVRKQGMPTADNKALDGDVILAAQAAMLQEQGYEVIIATGNVNHLARLADAREWRHIP